MPINVDPNHPDGFTLKNDMDVYNNYKDTPERYVQEMIYKYEGVPVKDAVKAFDSMDSSTYPYKQREALNAYSKVYDRLTPLQKKQIAKAKKKIRVWIIETWFGAQSYMIPDIGYRVIGCIGLVLLDNGSWSMMFVTCL